MENNEESEKYEQFESELLNENDFVKKIKDIFKLQYFEKLQDILILQKHQFLEQIEQEVLFILKKLYSSQIISNNYFNSLFKSIFKEFEIKYNSEYREVHSKFDFFLRLKSKSIKTNNNTDIEALNFYYLSNFRRHCPNHTGPALHKCGHAEKGKFIKISLNANYRNYLSNETMYIICEECKKVYVKDLINNFCSFCKENYLSSIISSKENKDNFLISYSNPHCDTFINRTIPCKLCKEKLYLFNSDKKIKCIKCNYIIDINSKNEINWQCPKCNKYFKSNIKYYNPSENLILTKILKKALLLKIKAKPQFINCCKIDINNTPFFHKKECKGLLYLCNVENYFLKNKKWAIVCEKCQAINNCKNFIWTCPKCGKRSRETNDDYDNIDNSYKKESGMIYEYVNDSNKKENNINLIGKDNMNNNNNNINNNIINNNYTKNNINKRYISEHRLKQSYSQLAINENPENKIKEKDSNLRKSANEKKSEIVIISRMSRLDKENLKLNLLKDDKFNNNNNQAQTPYNNRCYIIQRRRNYQINTNNNINNIKNKEEKNISTKQDLPLNKEEKNDFNDNKYNKSSIPVPRIRYSNKIKDLKNSCVKEEEKNLDKKILRCESYKANLLKENNDANNLMNNDEEKIKVNEKNNSAFKINSRKNIPVRLKYSNKNINNNNNNNINNNNNNNAQCLRDSFDEINNNINNNNLIEKNEEEFLVKKNLIFTCTDGCNSKKSSNDNERISKETTSHCSIGSGNSLSKDIKDNISINIVPKLNINLNIKQSDNININNQNKERDFSKDRNSVSPNYNYNFKNKRKYYREEKEKRPSNNINSNNNEITNQKNNENNINKNSLSINSNFSYKYKAKNYASPSHKLTFLEKKRKELENNNISDNDKPDDVIEPQDIDFSQDIQVNDMKIKNNKTLYNDIQSGIKKILEKGRLPQFNIDNYTIEKKIGDGAFGVLFSVSNNKTKKKYALKKLTACDLTSLEDFQKEFEIAYKNNHENILNLYGICIRVYDVTTYVLFVLMDLAEHDWEIEINNRFKLKKFYTEIELISILKQLSSACVYLQKKEIAHRDIKPENILLFFDKKDVEGDKPATYKICDFGEAKEKIRVGSRHKSIRGTDYYMSPILFKALMEKERIVKDDPYKSDVFSLGYCMLIAAVLDFEFINKIRKVEEQRQIDRIIREALEERYSNKFIYVLLKMIVHSEKERIDFLGLEKLINDKL